MNDNSAQFHEFCNKHCFISAEHIVFTQCRRITWHLPDQVTQKGYDFVLASSWLCQYVSSCRVYNSYDFDLDHHLIMADICTPLARYMK